MNKNKENASIGIELIDCDCTYVKDNIITGYKIDITETNTEIDKINKSFDNIDRGLNIALYAVGTILIIQLIILCIRLINL